MGSRFSRHGAASQSEGIRHYLTWQIGRADPIRVRGGGGPPADARKQSMRDRKTSRLPAPLSAMRRSPMSMIPKHTSFLALIVSAFLLVPPGVAQQAPAPTATVQADQPTSGFVELAPRLIPAVVNISARRDAAAPNGQAPEGRAPEVRRDRRRSRRDHPSRTFSATSSGLAAPTAVRPVRLSDGRPSAPASSSIPKVTSSPTITWWRTPRQ
jgi:hypothetical protein